MVLNTIIIAIIIYVALGLRVVKEYERGVKFTLGRYTKLMQPGLRIVWPIIQTWVRVDNRVRVVDVPDQDCITQDNVSVNVNAVIYYQVRNSEMAVLKVERYTWAMSQLAQTTMRNIIGEVSLDELLSQRDAISDKIKKIIDKASDAWGIKVETVELKDVLLPQDMKRMMSRQAEAEREKRSNIIKAEGEVIAAENLAKAAKRLSQFTGALHLRTLQTLNDMSSDQSNTIVFAMPLEVLRAFESVGKGATKKR